MHLGLTSEGITLNGYFVDHPEMVLGEITTESTQYGKEECTVIPIPGADLGDRLHEAVQHIGGHYEAQELAPEEELSLQGETIPADPNVKNLSLIHISKNIRFITSNYEDRFKIPDGSAVEIEYPNRKFSARCEYMDEYHLRLGYDVLHICQLAEMLERGGGTCRPEPLITEECSAWDLGSKGFLAIQTCEDGYDYTLYPVSYTHLHQWRIPCGHLCRQRDDDSLRQPNFPYSSNAAASSSSQWKHRKLGCRSESSSRCRHKCPHGMRHWCCLLYTSRCV